MAPRLIRLQMAIGDAQQARADGEGIAAPVTASQSLTVLSSEADATTLPSGEKATELTYDE